MSVVVVHPGFVKTATSTLQGAVFPSLTRVNYLGLPSNDPAIADAIHGLCKTDGIRYQPGAVRDVFARHLDAERINVISYENLALYESKDKGLVACRLKEVFPDARIVFTIRNQRDLVRSWYLQQMRRRRPFVSFKGWWAQAVGSPHRSIIDDINFDDTIVRYEQLFGREHVGVFMFEILREDPNRFADDLAAFIGVEARAMAEAIGRSRLNPAVTNRHLAWARFVTYVVPAALASICARVVPAPAMAQFRRWQARGTRPSVPLSSEQDDVISALCAGGNRRLMERHGLPLSRFGYPC